MRKSRAQKTDNKTEIGGGVARRSWATRRTVWPKLARRPDTSGTRALRYLGVRQQRAAEMPWQRAELVKLFKKKKLVFI